MYSLGRHFKYFYPPDSNSSFLLYTSFMVYTTRPFHIYIFHLSLSFCHPVLPTIFSFLSQPAFCFRWVIRFFSIVHICSLCFLFVYSFLQILSPLSQFRLSVFLTLSCTYSSLCAFLLYFWQSFNFKRIVTLKSYLFSSNLTPFFLNLLFSWYVPI